MKKKDFPQPWEPLPPVKLRYRVARSLSNVLYRMSLRLRGGSEALETWASDNWMS